MHKIEMDWDRISPVLHIWLHLSLTAASAEAHQLKGSSA